MGSAGYLMPLPRPSRTGRSCARGGSKSRPGRKTPAFRILIMWRLKVCTYSTYPSISNLTPDVGPTQTEIRQKIAEEESKESAQDGYVALHDVTPLGFVSEGLSIEEQQCVLSHTLCQQIMTHFRSRIRHEVSSATASKLPALVQRRHALRRRIAKFRALQAVYMPAALALLSDDDKANLDVEQVEGIRLGLPSDFKAVHRERVCDEKLTHLESRLRTAQCNDALEDLRNKLHGLAHLYQHKKKNVRHQGANTRSRTYISKQEGYKNRAVEKYRHARRALLALVGPGDWELRLQVLHDDDIRHMVDDDPLTTQKKRKRKTGPAEGQRVISWIWRGLNTEGDQTLTDSFRVEWLKARARPKRWWEETYLCMEEMRRCLATLRHEERIWKGRSTARQVGDPHLQEGLTAYAADQEDIRVRMRDHFRTTCVAAAQSSGYPMGEEWLTNAATTDADLEAQAENDIREDLARMHALDEQAAITLQLI